jgi:hypothetical protein
MTMRKKPSTSLQQARERAASELGLPVADHRVERLAKLTIADEAMQSLLVVAPERVDFGKMLEVDQALSALRSELKRSQPMGLDVHIVEAEDMQQCPHCKATFQLAMARRTLKESQDAARERAKTDLENAVAQSADATPTKAPGSIVSAVPGAAAMSRPQVIDLEQQRAGRSAELRDEALKNNHHALKRNQVPVPSSPSIGSPFSDNESGAALSRRISESYR